MRDFKREIEDCKDWHELATILSELEQEVDSAFNSPYDHDSEIHRARDLELLLRYGEQRLEKWLS